MTSPGGAESGLKEGRKSAADVGDAELGGEPSVLFRTRILMRESVQMRAFYLLLRQILQIPSGESVPL